jgi:hypothetical protein
MPLQSFTVEIGLPFGLGKVAGTWAPAEAEREAAWEMYVELVTRISVEELRPGQGLLREALSSLYSLLARREEFCASTGQWSPSATTARTSRSAQ